MERMLSCCETFEAQFEEWQQLGIVDKSFKKTAVVEKHGKGKGRPLKPYQHLPVDTKHFEDLKIDILGVFEDLDAELDGRLIKSEKHPGTQYVRFEVLPERFRESTSILLTMLKQPRSSTKTDSNTLHG